MINLEKSFWKGNEMQKIVIIEGKKISHCIHGAKNCMVLNWTKISCYPNGEYIQTVYCSKARKIKTSWINKRIKKLKELKCPIPDYLLSHGWICKYADGGSYRV